MILGPSLWLLKLDYGRSLVCSGLERKCGDVDSFQDKDLSLSSCINNMSVCLMAAIDPE